MWETSFKNPPRRTTSVWGPTRCHQHTDFFAPTHPPVGQKMSLVNFKLTSANYTGFGTGYTSHNEEICLQGKRLKNNLKINQSD